MNGLPQRLLVGLLAVFARHVATPTEVPTGRFVSSPVTAADLRGAR